MFVTDKLKNLITNEIRDHFIDYWRSFKEPMSFVDLVDDYEIVRKTSNEIVRKTSIEIGRKMSRARQQYYTEPLCIRARDTHFPKHCVWEKYIMI